MTHELIPTQTGLTLRGTDTLISLANKLLAKTGVKGISEMSDDELWEWWLSLDDEWKFLLLRHGLELNLWEYDDWNFNKAYDYQADFDWLNRNLSLHYVKQLQGLIELILYDNQIQNIAPLANLTQLTELNLYDNQIQNIAPLANLTQLIELGLTENPINPQDIEWLRQQLPNCEIAG